MKSKNTRTIMLFLLTIFLIVATIITTIQLNSTDSTKRPLTTYKTKAATTTYTKLIALNTVTETPSPSPIDLTRPSPTEVQSPTPVSTSTPSAIVEVTTEIPTPTALPIAGFNNYSLPMFAAAALIIFFSFIY